jgi:hypothetical protein
MADQPQSTFSRRGILKKAAVGTAAVGVLAVATSKVAWDVQPGTSNGNSLSASAMPAPSTPIVAYVHDAAKGEVAIMIGSQEIIRHDPALVSYLVQCCGAEAV